MRSSFSAPRLNAPVRQPMSPPNMLPAANDDALAEQARARSGDATVVAANDLDRIDFPGRRAH